MSHPAYNEKRLIELTVADQLGDLSSEERAELAGLAAQRPGGGPEIPNTIGELLVLLDALEREDASMPEDLARRVSAAGKSIVGGGDQISPAIAGSVDPTASTRRFPAWVGGIAALVAVSGVLWGAWSLNQLRTTKTSYETRLAALQTRLDENRAVLDQSEASLAAMEQRIDGMTAEAAASERQLAEALRDKTDLARQLAEANTGLEDAQRRIALYEEPIDPAVLAERRQQLIDVPDAIQIAWQPFDLPDAPAEQRTVSGDVVWSDAEQRGYIRFVGLTVNDPDIEQYQVWVIDERGLEQKVSGGVFNASAEGEIIVPIEPGIDVGRVALFAVTVEEPGGTWVPDLSRRVVVAPREG